MFSSGFGKRPKHRKFDYLPRYYDPEKEALEQTINQYKGNQSEAEKVKSRISSGLRQKYIGDDTYRRSTIKKSNLKVLYIVIILSFLTYMIIKSERILKMVEAFTQ